MSTPVEKGNRVLLQSAAAATGNGTVMDVTGYSSAKLQVSGTFSATTTFESTVDMQNWVTQEAYDTNGTRVTTATAAGIFKIDCAGLAAVRGRISTYASGNVTIHGMAVKAAGTTLVALSSVAGGAADGAAVSGNPVLVAGSDGTNAETIRTDSTGRPVVVGGAADGAAVAGNPVLIAGSDGTNAETVRTDSTGRVVVIGGAADGGAVAGNPVLIAGQDGTNAQSLRTDTTGRLAHPYKATANLLGATVITTDLTAQAGSAVTGFGGYDQLTVLLTVAAKTMDASTVLNIYVQTSPDDGTTWDDIISFTQLTSAAVANGTYVATVVNATDAGAVDRVTRSASLTANNIVDYFGDQLRVAYTSANFSGTDTVTITVSAIAQ